MAKKHFFQPLLPGFHSHLTIPVAFFSKYIEGRNDQKTAKLRSDASKITWEVRIENGQKLTVGWKEFALAHDLRVGDILIFRQEKDMAFHVTLLGPSCCEIQYESCLEDDHNLEKKKVKKNPKREAGSSSLDPSCFLAKVTPSTLSCDSLNLPKSFVRANDLETRDGKIFLVNEKGTSWTLALKQRKNGNTYIRGGWRSFCHANELRVGSFFIFKLMIKRGGILVLRKSPFSIESEIESLSTESDSDEESNQDEKSFKRPRSIWKPSSSSPSQNRFVTLTLSPYSVKRSILFLPLHFTDLHGITVGTKMCLLDKNGVRWSTKLRSEGNRIRLVGGWKDFFKANCVMTGESVMLKLILNEDTSCALQFSSKVKP